MSPEDSHMAFSRHATSKIRELPDIFTCGTLGFRGEALASIAAISRVTLLTKEKGGDGLSGTRIVMEGGELLEDQEAGSPFGTSVRVERIFSNTPARKKFQKSLAAEFSLITGIIERLAVTHPKTAIRLVLSGREKISTPGNGNLLDTIIRLFGLDLAQHLVPVDTVQGRVAVIGYASIPDLNRKNTYQMFVSVNHRAVSSLALNTAIREAYGTLLPGDRYPVVFLDLSIPGSDVDVNVHPSKREVRFSRESEIRDLVKSAVADALSAALLIPKKGVPGESKNASRSRFRYPPLESPQGEVREPLLRERLLTGRQLRLTESSEPGRAGLPEPVVIGQLGELYILARTTDGDLLIIDQHAAHERILYEKVSARSRSPDTTQELIDPVILHLSPREELALAASLPALKDEGFLIEEFGRHDFAVRSVPVTLGRSIDPGTVRDIVAELIAPGISTGPDPVERLRRIIACRGAVKAGAFCTKDQCEQLVRQLCAAENPFTCPHGRPTMVSFSLKKLDEIFGR
ncbi:MAG: DNA mismatch repair protein MutL [Methanoregulaceae archaeon]|nr:DNA mismatch repair protein MutL [Methanoregulaceae archaeon]